MSYALLRKLHGLFALGLGALLVLYAVSGWMIIHRVGGGAPESTLLRVPADAVGGEGEAAERVRAVAAEAAARAGLSAARAEKPAFADGVWRVKLTRVARSAEVTLTPGAAEAQVALRQATVGEGVKRLHRLNAVGASGGWLAWAWLVDGLSLALLGFSFTGVLLFRAVKRKRRLGWLLLAASSLYTVGGIAWLALSR